MATVECNNGACVNRFSNGKCMLHKTVRHDSNGVCTSQESVCRSMSDYPGRQSPGIEHGSHGYTQQHGRTVK